MPFFGSCDAKLSFADGEIMLEEKSAYPYYGEIVFAVKGNTTGSKKQMRLFLPPWAKAGSASVRINGDVVETELKNGFLLFYTAFFEGDVISFHFDQELTAKFA